MAGRSKSLLGAKKLKGLFFYSNRQSVKNLFKKSPGRSVLPDGSPAANFTPSPGKHGRILFYAALMIVRGPFTSGK